MKENNKVKNFKSFEQLSKSDRDNIFLDLNNMIVPELCKKHRISVATFQRIVDERVKRMAR